MTLADLGESGLFALLREWTEGGDDKVVVGPGDDGAVLAIPRGRQLVVSTDAYRDGVHFDGARHDPSDIGYRSMAGSLSDLAAMGAEALAAFVNLHAPPTMTVEFLREVYRGMDRVAGASGATIAGGDSVRGEFALGITVIGHVAPGEAVLRTGAQEGDVLCVSGPLGGGEIGRRLMSGEIDAEISVAARAEAESAFGHPRPRFDVARLLTTLERRTVDVDLEHEDHHPVRPTAMIDISDGLSTDLLRLCEASHVGCAIEDRLIPVAAAAREVAAQLGTVAVEYALSGGEDYELLFSIPAHDVELLLDTTRGKGITISPIGTIAPFRDGCRRVDAQARSLVLEASGWDHFQG